MGPKTRKESEATEANIENDDPLLTLSLAILKNGLEKN